MSFFEDLEGRETSTRESDWIGLRLVESADIDFLNRVQQTQKEIGNAKDSETLSTPALTEKCDRFVAADLFVRELIFRQLMFGGVDDGDEEEDFFKEFALEDLDAPPSQQLPPKAKDASRSNGTSSEVFIENR